MENRKCLEFPNSGIEKCEVAKLGITEVCLVREESEDETKIASSNRGPARRGTTRKFEGQMRQCYEADF